MPEELEILRINIILPEDSDDILALAPKDVDVSKKDKVKRWVEKSFKNLDRLKLNLGGELDAEGFFGMEQQGDGHPEKVLLCVYSKDKVKLSSFVAVLGNICFRPSTSKKGGLPFLGEWVNEKSWKSKVTLHGGFFKHTEMVRFRKILKRRRQFSGIMQSRHESQPIINYSVLKYYKPYIVDRHGRSKPVIKSLCDRNPDIARNNDIETINSKRKLHRTIKKKDLINPIIMHSLCKLNPLEFDQTINKLKTNNLKQGSFENINRRFLCVYDTAKIRKSDDHRCGMKLEKDSIKQSYAHPTELEQHWNKSYDTDKTKHSGTLPVGKLSGSNADNCPSRSTQKYTEEEKYKIFLSKSPSAKSIFEEVTNSKESGKIIGGSVKNIGAVSYLKSNKSIGVQVPSRFSSNGLTNGAFHKSSKRADIKKGRCVENVGECEKCRIDEETRVKSLKLTSFPGGEETKLSNKVKQQDQIMRDKVRHKIIKNYEEFSSAQEVNKYEKQRKTRTNCKRLYCCFKCLRRRQKRRRPTNSFNTTNKKKHLVGCNSYSDEKAWSKHPRRVPKDERESSTQSMSEEEHKKQGIFRKLFTRKTKYKKEKSLRYYGKIYMGDESEFQGSEAEIIERGNRDARSKVRHSRPSHQHSQSSSAELCQSVKFKNDGFCNYCGHSNRMRPIRCRRVVDSLQYMKRIKESKHDHIEHSLYRVQNTKSKSRKPDESVNVTENLKSSNIRTKDKRFSKESTENQSATECELNVKELTDITLPEYRTKTDFDPNQLYNTIEDSIMKGDRSKHQCALPQNKRDSDELKNNCGRDLDIIDYCRYNNSFPNIKGKSRNKTADAGGNGDKENHFEREELSSVLDIVKIKAKALHYEHVSRKPRYSTNMASEFQQDLVSDNNCETAENITRVVTDVDKTRNSNAVLNLDVETEEQVNPSPRVAPELTFHGKKNNQINKNSKDKDSIFKTLNEALNAFTSNQEIIKPNITSNNNYLTDRIETSSNSEYLRDNGKCFNKFLSKDRAQLSLVEKRIEGRKIKNTSEEKRKEMESVFKAKSVWSSDQTINMKPNNKRLFSA